MGMVQTRSGGCGILMWEVLAGRFMGPTRSVMMWEL